MLLLLRQGKVSKWFSGIGQEAVAVGSTLTLDPGDYVLPLHRNLGVFTARAVPWERLFAQWQGKPSGFTHGRDRSFHFGSIEHRIIGMISHLGAMLGVADGLALASILDQSGHIALVYSGDGGASEGDFHEAINVAAVWDLPVIFLVENNGYGLSAPSKDQFRCRQFIDKAVGYGIDAVQVDGNDILDVYHAVSHVAADIRKRPRPILLEAMTFRMRGHEEASGTKYVPQALFDAWTRKDPLSNCYYLAASKGMFRPIITACPWARRRWCKPRTKPRWLPTERACIGPAKRYSPWARLWNSSTCGRCCRGTRRRPWRRSKRPAAA